MVIDLVGSHCGDMFLHGKSFLFMPGADTSSLSFLRTLIEEHGGNNLGDVKELNPETIVLVNDSYVDSNGDILHVQQFEREFGNGLVQALDRILELSLPCVKASSVVEWIKEQELTLQPDYMININKFFEETSSQEQKDTYNSSENDTEFENDEHSIKIANNIADAVSINSNSSHTSNTSLVKDDDGLVQGGIEDNEKLIIALEKMAKKYDIKGDQYRAKSYNIAKYSVMRSPFKITSGTQANKHLAHIGPSIAYKIQKVLDTGTIPGLDEPDVYEAILEYFSRCHSVGTHTAKRWHLLGYRNFSEVLKNDAQAFSNEWQMLFGWSYYEDWSRRISRNESEAHLAFVQRFLSEIDTESRLELCGSYGRGSETCGDVDLMFYKKDCDDKQLISSIIEKLCLKLYHVGFIKCFLQLSPNLERIFMPQIRERFSNAGLNWDNQRQFYTPTTLNTVYLGTQLPSTYKFSEPGDAGFKELKAEDKFMSLCQNDTTNNNFNRRLDIFSCKWSELGSARIHWIGPKNYNRLIRVDAMKKGFKLTQHGLFKDDIKLESFDERRIFELLGIQYLPASQRQLVEDVK